MKDFLRNLGLFVITCALAFLLALKFGYCYNYFFPQSPGGGFFWGPSFAQIVGIIGLPLAYMFFLSLLFTAFGGLKKYWWIGILLIPAVIFEVYFDLTHIYFPILLGLVGWALGWGISKLMPK